MERRDWSIKAFEELRYIDSLDPFEKAQALVRWGKKYLSDETDSLDLTIDESKQLSELFYKNTNFLKKYKNVVYSQMKENKKLKKYLQNS